MQNYSMEPKCVSGFKRGRSQWVWKSPRQSQGSYTSRALRKAEVSLSRDRTRPSKALLDLLAVLLKSHSQLPGDLPYIEKLAKYFRFRETNL